MQIIDLLLISLTILSNFSIDAPRSLPINNICGDLEHQTYYCCSLQLYLKEKNLGPLPGLPSLSFSLEYLSCRHPGGQPDCWGKVYAIGTDFGSQKLDMS